MSARGTQCLPSAAADANKLSDAELERIARSGPPEPGE